MFWVELNGSEADGSIKTERLSNPFPDLSAAIDYAENLMENHAFPWGNATSFQIMDDSENIVLRGSIHA